MMRWTMPLVLLLAACGGAEDKRAPATEEKAGVAAQPDAAPPAPPAPAEPAGAED